MKTFLKLNLDKRSSVRLRSTLFGATILGGAALSAGCYEERENISISEWSPSSEATTSSAEIFTQAVTTERAAPIRGNNICSSKALGIVAVADEDRDLVQWVEAATDAVHTVSVDAAVSPSHVVIDEKQEQLLVLSIKGSLISQISIKDESILKSVETCSSAQHMALSADGSKLVVVCKSGAVIRYSTADLSELSREQYEDDLREIVTIGEYEIVSRFRSADLLLIKEGVGLVSKLDTQIISEPFGLVSTTSESTVAWSLVARGTLGVSLIHQGSSTAPLRPVVPYYGSANGGVSIVQYLVTNVDLKIDEATGSASLIATTQSNLGTRPPPYSANYKEETGDLRVVSTGLSYRTGSTPVSVVGSSQVEDDVAITIDDEEIVSTTELDGEDWYYCRQPSSLIRKKGQKHIALSELSRKNTGQAIFHMDSGTGINCASCHPQGGEDGHAWDFAVGGLRRTQQLLGGVSSRGRFHWDGELPNFDAFVNEVMVSRMGFDASIPPTHTEALLGWLDTLPSEKSDVSDLEAEAISAGEVLFNSSEVGCSSCHSGVQLSDSKGYDVGTGSFLITPSLLGLRFRAPYMHDGCAKTLEERFSVESCGGGEKHGHTSDLSIVERSQLLSYLKSL